MVSGMTEAEREAARIGFEDLGKRMTLLEQRVLGIEGVATASATENTAKFDILIQQSAANHQEWSHKFATTDQQVTGKIAQIEAQILRLSAELQHARSNPSSGQGARNGSFKSYLPMKQMTPNRFGGKEEQWREWQEEVRGFIDASRSGMEVLLRGVEKEGTGSTNQ